MRPRRLFALLLATILVPAGVHAQSEFVVNTFQDSTQRDPQIERDAAGNYIVVWKSLNQVAPGSRGDIYFQRFSATDQRLGPETRVNTVTVGEQDRPALAMNGAGDFVISWASFAGLSSGFDIKARVYRNNLPLGDEITVNSTLANSQNAPDVAIDSAGNFVAVWESWGQDGGDRGVFAQRFSPTGVKLGTEFRVNVTTAYSQARPVVKMMRGGHFLVLWESWRQDAPAEGGYGLYGRIFDPAGSPVTGEFPLNTTTADYQWFADAEVFDDNSFAAVWCSWRQDGSEGGIVLQRFTAAGARVGGEAIVNITTISYQWLPKIRRLPGGGFAVVWSSWKQDGSREGVFCRLFDTAQGSSFETAVNSTTAGYQWEPAFIATGGREILAVWASWGQTGRDYDIVARRVTAEWPQGHIDPRTYAHYAGRSTSRVLARVVDSLALTGNTYEVSFDTLPGKRAYAHVVNLATGDSVVRRYPLDLGEGIFYRTPTFQGTSVQIIPELDLALDTLGSYMVNRSGTNVGFAVASPTAGAALLAPIDVELIWGRTDTLPNGRYAFPLDTALSISGQRTVVVPFLGWNRTDNNRLTMLVVEVSGAANQRWDPGDRIIFLTPPPYRVQSTNTHAQITTFVPGGAAVWPGVGDTNVVLTMRPILPADRYRFTTSRSLLLDAGEHTPLAPERTVLAQNYPNPFNPATSIQFSLGHAAHVRLSVFDLLGREVATLVDEVRQPGTHTVRWDASAHASGVYFCRLHSRPLDGATAAGLVSVRKLLLLR